MEYRFQGLLEGEEGQRALLSFFNAYNVYWKERNAEIGLKYQEIICLCLKKIRLCDMKKENAISFWYLQDNWSFSGKMNWEHREAVEWLWRTIRGGRLNIPIQCSVFAGVCTVALGDGGWGPGECVSHTEWTLGVLHWWTGGHLCFRAEHESQREQGGKRPVSCLFVYKQLFCGSI